MSGEYPSFATAPGSSSADPASAPVAHLQLQQETMLGPENIEITPEMENGANVDAYPEIHPSWLTPEGKERTGVERPVAHVYRFSRLGDHKMKCGKILPGGICLLCRGDRGQRIFTFDSANHTALRIHVKKEHGGFEISARKRRTTDPEGPSQRSTGGAGIEADITDAAQLDGSEGQSASTGERIAMSGTCPSGLGFTAGCSSSGPETAGSGHFQLMTLGPEHIEITPEMENGANVDAYPEIHPSWLTPEGKERTGVGNPVAHVYRFSRLGDHKMKSGKIITGGICLLCRGDRGQPSFTFDALNHSALRIHAKKEHGGFEIATNKRPADPDKPSRRSTGGGAASLGASTLSSSPLPPQPMFSAAPMPSSERYPTGTISHVVNQLCKLRETVDDLLKNVGELIGGQDRLNQFIYMRSCLESGTEIFRDPALAQSQPGTYPSPGPSKRPRNA